MYSVLIVEDERPARELLKKLGDWKKVKVSEIYEAESAKKGLEIVHKKHPEIIICDMKMPEKDGAYFLREIKEAGENAQILVVSAYTDFEYTQQAIVSRVFNYLLKPINVVELNRNLLEIYNILEEKRQYLPGEDDEVQNGEPDSLAANIRKYVETNYASQITLDDLAGKFYASKEHISRAFKREYNMCLFDYINEFRLERVKELLRGTSASVDEIAIKTGFSCGNYLSKVFKKKFGVSPGEYRYS